MSNRIKVPFPRYLNAKKLFYRYEYDVILAPVASFVVSFVIQIWLSVPLLVGIIVSFLIAYFTMKKYIKFFKKARKGYISHLGYSKGYKEPFDRTLIVDDYEEYLIPRGFENDFKD